MSSAGLPPPTHLVTVVSSAGTHATPEREKMRFPLFARPPDPPLPPTQDWWFGGPGYTLAAFLIWFFYTRACIALARGHLGRLQPQHAKLTFLCLPIAALVHAVSHFSESHGAAEANFLSSLPGKVLDRSLLLHLGATTR